MPKSIQKKRSSKSESKKTRETLVVQIPDVIVDFVFDDGLFFISIENIGDQPALNVTTKFKEKIFGVGGRVEISALPLFRNIEFLAPHKSIKTFLDTSDAYFKREGVTKISVSIQYKDTRGKIYKKSIRHDLDIYKDIGYIKRQWINPNNALK
jgi:hypothetical protein